MGNSLVPLVSLRNPATWLICGEGRRWPKCLPMPPDPSGLSHPFSNDWQCKGPIENSSASFEDIRMILESLATSLNPLLTLSFPHRARRALLLRHTHSGLMGRTRTSRLESVRVQDSLRRALPFIAAYETVSPPSKASGHWSGEREYKCAQRPAWFLTYHLEFR